MKTNSDFVQCIREEPDNIQRVKVYADWLMDKNNVSRFGALREATRERVLERWISEVSRAVNLINKKSWLLGPLQLAIAHHCGFDAVLLRRVSIAVGSRPPIARRRAENYGSQTTFSLEVTVGARWILRAAEVAQARME